MSPASRKRYEATLAIEESEIEPLKEAIACILQMRQNAKFLSEAREHANKPETKAQLTLAISKAIPDEFSAWIKIAEFVYAKPRQTLDVSGTVTLEQVLAASHLEVVG